MIWRLVSVCLLATLALFITACSDDNPVTPQASPYSETIGDAGGWVLIEGLARLGVPPMVLDEPETFEMNDVDNLPSLPERYVLVGAARVKPSDRTFPEPLVFELLTSADHRKDYDLLRLEEGSWVVANEQVNISYREDGVAPWAWTDRLGLLAIVIDTSVETTEVGLVGSILQSTILIPLGDELVSGTDYSFAGFLDHEEDNGFIAAGGVWFGDQELRPGNILKFYTYSADEVWTVPGMELTVHVESSDEVPAVDEVFVMPSVRLSLTSHHQEQVIGRNEDLHLTWDGASPGFVRLTYGTESYYDYSMVIPNSGSYLVDQETLDEWVGESDRLKINVLYSEDVYRELPGFTSFKFHHDSATKVELIVE